MASNKWFLASGGKGYGPFAPDQLRQMVDAGIIEHDDLVWSERGSESTPAFTVGNEPPLPMAASGPSPPPLPVLGTPALSQRPSRVRLRLSLAAVLLAMLGGGGWFAYERGWLMPSVDQSKSLVAEDSTANTPPQNEESEEPASSLANNEDLPASAPSFDGLNAPPEETVPETTPPTVALPVPVLYLPFDPSVATIPSNQTVERRKGRQVAGKMGQAVSFDGSSYTELEASLPLGNSPRTLALWVRSDTGAVIGKTPFVVSQTEKWERAKAFGLIDSTNGNWRFQDMNGDLDSRIEVDRNWHHLAVTHDGTTTRFFLDGTQVAQANRKLETESRRLRIGGIGGSGNNFVGLIDELYVFDAPLTENQIRQLLNGAVSSSATRISEPTDTVDSIPQSPLSHGRVISGNVALATKGARATGPYAKSELLLDGKPT